MHGERDAKALSLLPPITQEEERGGEVVNRAACASGQVCILLSHYRKGIQYNQYC